ncbi:MAG: PrsW family glutamic-type intramembrane protease [Acidimicrobiales bacterium]
MQPVDAGQGPVNLPPVPKLPSPPTKSQTPPGWYPDPWGITEWRWWDGWAWTPHVSGNVGRKPRLRGWLSWPVVLGLVVALPMTIFIAIDNPIAIPLAFIPVLMVGPVLWWIDRVEPEPVQDRVHSFLWGASIAGVVAGIVNSVVFAASSETWAAVVSAPLSEEIMKAGGILWALRRREIDGVMDGVVYAGWVAVGFAVVENFLYFSDAVDQDVLVQTVIARGLLTPFAHPLFTVWSGLAIGWAVARNKNVAGQLAWGLPIAIGLHAAWNGSLVLGEDNEVILLVAIPAFVVLFLVSGVALIRFRRREQAAYLSQVPALSLRYGLSAQEVATFGHWRTMLATRRTLPKQQRKSFDQVHGNLARLAALHNRPGPLDTAAEAVLVSRLHTARSGG